jgi:hypothetical protein
LLLLPVRMTQTAVAATARPNVLRDRSHKWMSPTGIIRERSKPNSQRRRRRHFTIFVKVVNGIVGMMTAPVWRLWQLNWMSWRHL